MMITIIQHTPYYVWLILTFIIYVGYRETKTHSIFVPMLLLRPFAILWSQVYLMNVKIFNEVYSASLFAGILLGYYYNHKNQLSNVKNFYTFKCIGNYSTLIILMAYFCTQYYCQYKKAVDPLFISQSSQWLSSVNGLFAGYFWGQSLILLKKLLHKKRQSFL